MAQHLPCMAKALNYQGLPCTKWILYPTVEMSIFLCTVLSGWTNGLNVVRMRHPWYEVNCQNLILYPAAAVTSFIAGFLFFTRQWRHSFKQFFKKKHDKCFRQNCTKVWFPRKVFCRLVMSHIRSFLNIFAGCNMFKLSRQAQRRCLDIILIPYISCCAHQLRD